MTDDLGTRLTEHFGPEALLHIDTANASLPTASGAALANGLPAQVGPYFSATQDEPLLLSDYAASIDADHTPPESASWFRLGTDQGAEICVTPTGTVKAVFVVTNVAPLHVNTDVPSFLESLLTLDKSLPLLRSPGQQDPVAVFRDLRSRLLQIDAPALDDDESWWSRVLELIRHALSFPASVAFEVEENDGRKHIETQETQVGVEHPEHLLWHRLSSDGVRPEQITRVYTELEPCFMPGNYCAMWLNQFPNAEFTYSYDYGATAEEREAGMLELINHAAAT
ncbi:nucleic acid/nucleotide deaminase domain-containing protein [Actinomadura sp. 1N219]|uniref:nucleic acid/nucleotide deaminase domain-containing protein n=1 Tax=Actinomadura sp. 1N219 TaxID=3375152 RepID=UPI00379F4347